MNVPNFTTNLSDIYFQVSTGVSEEFRRGFREIEGISRGFSEGFKGFAGFQVISGVYSMNRP